MIGWLICIWSQTSRLSVRRHHGGMCARADARSSIVHADLGKKKSLRGFREGEYEIAAEDEVIIVVCTVAIIDGFAALDTLAIARREIAGIYLRPERRSITDGGVRHEWKLRHAGNGSGIIGLQRGPEFLDEAIKLLLHGRRSARILWRLREGGSEMREKSHEQSYQRCFHGFTPIRS
ncbi:hypothetical protein [Nitrobacter winogradskyi]|uniref:Uncharacterized protein n=1 Tax=Nitrobacter winogradskyi TaxID=913 RepID=A0ACC6AFT0_NITWI|nr:hypothetical protein [Nitrobacter winogradskyi]MCP1998378.1 hypothetical protein [Nitrobacter winogradskyi]